MGDWKGSYILAFASYNAGGGNVMKWVKAYGDPRKPGVDEVDWIERIPFSETRNYVQRVLENLAVYRRRLFAPSQEAAAQPAEEPSPAPLPEGRAAGDGGS
jgi:soluble lytic murein transglycosylase